MKKSKEFYQIPWKGVTMITPIMYPRYTTGVYQPVSEEFSKQNEGIPRKQEALDLWDKCELPRVDIWDDEIMPFVDPYEHPRFDCNKNFIPMTDLRDGVWSIATQDKNVTCRARCHWRKTEYSNIIGKWMFKPGPVKCEILETVCSKHKRDIYGYIHTQILSTPKREPKVDIAGSEQYDVIVVLLDSLSFSQAKRSLPRTISYMADHMDAVLFPYINKVGENSRPNGAALWFGKSIEKLDRSLFGEDNIAPDWSHYYMCHVFKDNETSLFDEFQSHGYKTLLAEDWADGTLNWPNCKGYDKPPVDHYMRPFQNAMEREKHGVGVTKNHLYGVESCREHHHTLLDYLEQFMVAYPDQKKFGWIWASMLGHDSENGFAHSDNDFYSFLNLYQPELENSFVFFMGDHGLRFGDVRGTTVGALDVNNPFLAVSVPKKLRKSTKLLDMMKENSQKLQTHYDTRATMLDVLKYQSANNYKSTSLLQIPNEKGYSYIRKQPDILRNCKNMPIPMEYCICQFNRTYQAVETKTALAIGTAVTDTVNQQLIEGNFTDSCMKMEMSHVVFLLEFDEKFRGATLYTVVAQMKEPSHALFKANVKILGDNTIKVLGMVERSDRYGQTANCIKSEHHRPYCYCKTGA
ncbi:unnamed protein product [Caenorhabditis brenneri]